MRSDRSYRFDRTPADVWAAVERVDAYQRWWPWLRHFDAAGLETGNRWTCIVRPPLPYALRFTIELDEVDEPRRIAATVSGDIGGESVVSLSPAAGGCVVRLTSALAPTGEPLRSITRVAPWAARFGHDWVLATGLRQFRRRAL